MLNLQQVRERGATSGHKKEVYSSGAAAEKVQAALRLSMTGSTTINSTLDGHTIASYNPTDIISPWGISRLSEAESC